MATHDYNLANASGASFRADLNNALQAILTNNSSASSPSTTAAYMFWADTNTGILKIRNSSNDAWVELLQLDGTLTLEDGSASAVALGFRDELNTGIFSSGANNFDVSIAGTTRLNISASGINITGTVTDDGATHDGDVTFTGAAANIVFDKSEDALRFNDNAKAVFGTNGDLKIFHNGSNSIINDGGTGDLLLQLGSSTKFSLNSSGAEVHGDIIIADKIIHDGDTNTAIRFPAADTVAVETGGSERFRLDSSGNCGIGTDSADTKLHVHKGSAGSVSADGNAVLALENSNHCVLNIMTPADKSAYLMFGDPDDINAGQIRYDNNTNQLLVDVNGSERLRVDSSGQLALGVTSTSAKCHIHGTNTELIRLSAPGDSSNVNQFGIGFVFSAAQTNPAALISVLEFDASDNRGHLVFATRGSNSDSAPSERARILSDGSFCVGDTAAGARLHVKGGGNGSGASTFRAENSDNTELFLIRNDGGIFTGADGGSPLNFTGGSANVHIDSNARLRVVSSSKRYKEDIKNALWGLAEVLKLRPVTFKYKTQGEDEKDKKYAGFTAEEVHDLGLTDFVDYRNNRPESINYPNMVALMAKAIQELNAKVAVLEAS